MRDRAARFVVYALLGVLVGLVVAGIEGLGLRLFLHWIVERPLWMQALMPTVGLIAAALILRYLGGGASTETSEVYIQAYHSRGPVTRLRDLPARLLAGCATVGLGGTLGLEGPAIFAGSTIGASGQHRLHRLFTGKDGKMLLVAGAAAGVAAIFKTPATGVLFALEAPYQGDVARRALLPALVASATSYLTFVTIWGTDELFPQVVGQIRFGRQQLIGAIVVGAAGRGRCPAVRHAPQVGEDAGLGSSALAADHRRRVRPGRLGPAPRPRPGRRCPADARPRRERLRVGRRRRPGGVAAARGVGRADARDHRDDGRRWCRRGLLPAGDRRHPGGRLRRRDRRAHLRRVERDPVELLRRHRPGGVPGRRLPHASRCRHVRRRVDGSKRLRRPGADRRRRLAGRDGPGVGVGLSGGTPASATSSGGSGWRSLPPSEPRWTPSMSTTPSPTTCGSTLCPSASWPRS